MIDVNDFKIGLIYKYTSPSGKIYIGQTINEKVRKSSHRTRTKLTNTHFANAIKKYGFENLKYEVIIKFNPTWDIDKLTKILNSLEERYIKLYNSLDRNYGYNLTKGGEGTRGYVWSPEGRQKLSIAAKKRLENGMPEYIKDNLKLGRGKHSEETKKKMSNSSKTKKQVEQYDLDGNLLEIFNSIADAARFIEAKGTQKTKTNRIGECCNEKRKTIYGFI